VELPHVANGMPVYCQLVAHPVDDVEPVQLFMQQKLFASVQ